MACWTRWSLFIGFDQEFPECEGRHAVPRSPIEMELPTTVWMRVVSPGSRESAGLQPALSGVPVPRGHRSKGQGLELLRRHRASLVANHAARRVQYPWLAPSRSSGVPAHHTMGDVAPTQTASLARTDQKSGAYLSLLPHRHGSRCHRRCMLADTLQPRPRHGCSALNSSHDPSGRERLVTKSFCGGIPSEGSCSNSLRPG